MWDAHLGTTGNRLMSGGPSWSFLDSSLVGGSPTCRLGHIPTSRWF